MMNRLQLSFLVAACCMPLMGARPSARAAHNPSEIKDDCGFCHTNVRDPGPDESYTHDFNSDQLLLVGGSLRYCDNGEPDDHDCHDGGMPGSCTQYHPRSCGGATSQAENAEQFSAAIQLARTGKLSELAKLSRANSRISINRARHSLQILDCVGDHVMAQIPLSAHGAAALE